MNEEIKTLMEEAERMTEKAKQKKQCKINLEKIDDEFARYEPKCEGCEG